MAKVLSEREIIQKVAKGEMKPEEAERALEDARNSEPLTFKVSEKGALSVYGLNARFPTTLYKQQWRRLANQMPQLLDFIKAHEKELAEKKAKE